LKQGIAASRTESVLGHPDFAIDTALLRFTLIPSVYSGTLDRMKQILLVLISSFTLCIFATTRLKLGRSGECEPLTSPNRSAKLKPIPTRQLHRALYLTKAAHSNPAPAPIARVIRPTYESMP
jgi:hypothetical protein